MKTKEMPITDTDQDLSIFAKGLIFTLLLALNIEPEKLGYLLILIFIDSVTGVLRAIKLKEGLSFETFVWGISSKLFILAIPLLIAGMALVFQINLSFIVEGMIYIIAVNDFISIITNIGSMRSGKKYKNVDFLELAIGGLRNFFTNKIKGAIKGFNEDETP